jgi:ER membrane protein complex subunit 1
VGHQPVLRPGSSDQFVGYPIWTLSFPEGEAIKAMIKPHRGQVASIGKVLANRTTLYKYLNPRLFVLVTESSAGAAVSNEATRPGPTKGECGVYVVDAAKGTVVYRASVPAVAGPGGIGGTCDVKASLAENWLVYHYYDDDFSGQGQTKGWRMVSVELYEGKEIDDKTMRYVFFAIKSIDFLLMRLGSSDMSSYSSKSVDVMAIEQAYVFPYAITAMAPTSTKFGITNKDLIGKVFVSQFHPVC